MKGIKGMKRGITAIMLSVILVICGITGGLLIYRELKWNRLQQESLKELDELDGSYDTNKIVLNNTSYSKAKALATQFNATLRITSDGRFATLTLPEGVTVRDVYMQRENRQYLSDLSLDVYSKTSEEGESVSGRLPSAPDYTVSDSAFSRQSYINYLNLGDAWDNYRGSGITVAVIDTGIDTDHPEFVGKISEYSYNATEDKIVKDYTLSDGGYDWSLIEDEQGHGTSVSGVIAASMDGEGTVGIAPDVTLLVIKAECDENGGFYNTSDLVFGLYYAIERDVDIVNMSFGGYTPVNPYASATKLAVESDIVCVAASGNDGTTQLCYPAADENVIGVGALAENSWELANYSNYGENVDMVAPGTVYTTKKGGEYGTMNGTSFASPVTAAALALYKQQNRYAEFAGVRELLYASCYDLGSLGSDWYFGYGALDINALICEERGTVTFNMLTDELENTEQVFIRNHTLQNLPEPERTYAVFDGWYYDIHCTEEVNWYADVWTSDLTVYANWVNEEDGVPYTYVTLSDDTIEIRSYTGKRRYISVPEMIEGKVVSSIGNFAFDGQTRLREVNLPSGLTNIGAYAFRDCNNLVSVSVPEGVTKIGEYAFYNNVRLGSVAFEGGSKLQTVGSFAFAYSGLSRFELPAQVNRIDGSAFYGATGLKGITVNAANANYVANGGVLFNKTASTLIAYPAGLNTEYTIPSNVRSIGDYAFGYAKPKTINFGNVQTIGAYAFSYSALESVTLPDSVTAMGTGAFSCAFNLRQATIGSGLTGIPTNCFINCYSLAGMEIPANIRAIGASAFAKNYSLMSVTFASGSNLTQIGSCAFMYTDLRAIELPASLVAIGGGAFSYNFALSEVTFEENSNLQVIGGSAFLKAVSLTAIELPENLMQIGAYAFMETGLQTVTLPASVNYLGAGAFASCHSLTAIGVADGNAQYKDVNGVVYDAPMSEIIAYPAGNSASVYAIENTATAIGEAAFYGSWNLTGVTLPDGLVTVKQYGFYDCENITYYNLPESLTYIEAYAFSYNVNLGSLAMPDGVYQISNYAFAYDYNLRSITFSETATLPRISYGTFAYTGLYSFRVPASVSTMAQGAFAGCDDLTSITFAANSKLASISAYMFDGCTNLCTVTFESGSALTSVQAHGFEGARKLQNVDFGNAKITNIDNYAFRFCESLQTLPVPEGVTYIGRFAFYGANSLARLDLPESIDYIGRYAFYGASNLNVYFTSETLPVNLQENWDNGIAGYYVGVTDVATSGDWSYAVLKSGGVSIIKYNGTDTAIDLTALDLGGNIVSIGGYAFYNTGITSIVLPDPLTSIQAYAFARSALTGVIIPAGVEFIGQYAFFYTPLESVAFAQNGSLKVMEQYAFAYTKSLQSVALPASLSTMGSNAFYMSGITAVTFDEDSIITEIPESAFQSSNLVSVVLPDSVTLINHNAFRDCTYLQSVTFGAGEALRLMSNVFYNTGLERITIPANLTYIGEYALVGLENLTAFEVAENNPYYSSIDGLLYNKEGSKLIAVPAGRTGSIVLPESLENIGFGAFENTSLEEISFDEDSNILTFGYRAFYGAENLTSITIPASVVSIDFYAFAMCENLETVIFAEGSRLTGVYEGAFYGCKSLKNITLPDGIVEISDFAFYGCSALNRIPVSATNELKGIYDYAFAYTGITELTVPETVIDIGEYAFRGARLKTVVVPDANAKQLIIGIGAFADCNDLAEITLPFIGASFEDMDVTWFGYIFGAGGYMANSTYVPESLKTVTITEGITFVGTGAFCGLAYLKEINIPYSVTTIWRYSFYQISAKYELKNVISICPVDYDLQIGEASLNHYFIQGTLTGKLTISEGIKVISLNELDINEIDIPNSCEVLSLEGCNNIINMDLREKYNLKEVVFHACEGLKYVQLPNQIERFSFFGCISLRNANVPNKIEKIPMYAFNGCKNLKEIEIPQSVKIIENGAFSYCESLQKIIVGSNVEIIEDYAFLSDFRLTYIELPAALQYIGNAAFSSVGGVIVNNKSSLPIQLGKDGFGDLGYYAKGIIDANGNKTYIDESFQYYETNDGFKFSISNEKYTLLAYIGEEEEVFLPKYVNGEKYTISRFIGPERIIIPAELEEISAQAFSTNSSLKSIILEEGITKINYAAFSLCINLNEVILPESLISIEDSAFAYCYSLKQIYIPKNVEFIHSNSLFCSNIEEINIDVNNKFYAYEKGILYNSAITEIIWVSDKIKKATIPRTVISIGSAFSNKNIEEIFFEPESCLFSIEANAFFNCQCLKEIAIPEGVFEIGFQAFYNCRALKKVILPNSIEIINMNVFGNCINLNSIENTENLVSIGAGAFSGCKNLSVIRFSNKLSDIGDRAFADSSIENIVFINSSDYFVIENGILFDYNKTKIIYVCKGVQYITIPKSVNEISTAFWGNEDILEVVIEDGTNLTCINNGVFANCINLYKIYIPEGVSVIGDSAFSGTAIFKITLPATLTELSPNAFSSCVNLKTIYNKSDLAIDFTYLENSWVISIEDKYGNVKYKDENSQTSYYYLTEDDFLFYYNGYYFELKGYNGNKETIELPEDFLGEKYYIHHFTGGKKVIVPNDIDVGQEAFYGNTSIKEVILPPMLTKIGAYAFYGCSQLELINFPESLETIGLYAFAHCNNLEKWKDGCLYIGNNLIEVDDSVNSFTLESSILGVADGAFEGCYSLTHLTIGGNHESLLSSLTNLETLVLTEMPTSHYVYGYFGSTSNIPITLDTVIIKEGAQITSSYEFHNITGVTIYVEANKLDCPWDSVYPGWNNGNKVYYGGEWIEATFYDTDGEILSDEFYTTSQVIRQPYLSLADDGQYSEVLLGWDLDGDGIADSVPATSNKNIVARAIIATKLNEYTVKFYDKDGITVLYAYILPYGATFELPAEPIKQGYTFLGWRGYTDGMIVTGDLAIYSEWQHDGEGHNYIKTTVAPTCTEEGYDLYTCSICGESYKENIVETTGHVFDEWITDEEATCESKGSRHRVCTVCGEREDEEIEAFGHSYIGVITKESTCTEYGEITYTCEHCGDIVVEQTEMTGHNYEKKYVSKSWLRWLVEKLLNIFFGYEGTQGYYYECVDCRHIQTAEEAMLLNASVQSVCNHELGDEELVLAATCDEQGIYGRYCTKCGELVEARTVDALGHDYRVITVIAPTCTEQGYTLYACSHCGGSYKDNYVAALSHDLIHHEGKEATCTEKGWKAYDTCSRCDYTTYEELAALGHDLVHHEGKEPTCTEKGWTAYDTCSRCDYTTYEEIAALGHDLVHHEGKEPTCTEKGWNAYDTCSRCDYTTYEELAALGHDLIHHEGKEPTCTEKGWNAYETCSRCDYTTYEELVALGHDLIHHEGQEPTCTEKGWNAYETCSRCDYTTYEEVAALGHDLVHHEGQEATCTEKGWTAYDTCSRCDYTTYEEVAALGHDLIDHEGQEATCTEKGWTAYETCSRCDYTTYEELAALGHLAGEWITDREAAEGVAGHRHKECSVCGEILEEEEIPALPVDSSSDSSSDTDSDSSKVFSGSESINVSVGCFGSIGEVAAVLAIAVLGVTWIIIGKQKKRRE